VYEEARSKTGFGKTENIKVEDGGISGVRNKT
jgi:hypothetical protein